MGGERARAKKTHVVTLPPAPAPRPCLPRNVLKPLTSERVVVRCHRLAQPKARINTACANPPRYTAASARRSRPAKSPKRASQRRARGPFLAALPCQGRGRSRGGGDRAQRAPIIASRAAVCCSVVSVAAVAAAAAALELGFDATPGERGRQAVEAVPRLRRQLCPWSRASRGVSSFSRWSGGDDGGGGGGGGTHLWWLHLTVFKRKQNPR